HGKGRSSRMRPGTSGATPHSPRPLLLVAGSSAELATGAIGVHRAIADRLVDDDIAVANLHVVQTVRIGADPRFVLDRCALASKVRERHQVAGTALPTPRKRLFHAHRPFR